MQPTIVPGVATWSRWQEDRSMFFNAWFVEGEGGNMVVDPLEPDAADVVLADDAKWLRERLKAAGVPGEAIARHLAVLGNKPAMEAALAWYRARGAIRSPLGPIRVPTLYIWGDADDTVGRAAAEGTADFIAAFWVIQRSF